MSLERSDRIDMIFSWRDALLYLCDWERRHIQTGGGVPEDEQGELKKIASVEGKLKRGLQVHKGDGAAMSSYKKRKDIPLTPPQITDAYHVVLDAVVWATIKAAAREKAVASNNAEIFKHLIEEAKGVERGKWFGGKNPDADDHQRISLMIWLLLENLHDHTHTRPLEDFDYSARLLSDLERRASDDQQGDIRAQVCPECGHQFQGNGWDGIDAHWKSPRVGHEHIMPYKDAWPIIKAGGKPSDHTGSRTAG